MSDETTWRANHVTSRVRAVGGRLRLEDDRIVFAPHALDRALAAGTWEVPRDRVRRVEVAPRRPTSHFFGAGLRRQLRVVDADGADAHFVVNRVGEVAAAIERWAGGG